MPKLKVRCPECDASVRQTVDPVEEPTEVDLTCPQCDCEFTTKVKPDAPEENDEDRPAKKPAKKPERPTKAAKPTRRRDDDEDEDEEDDRPAKKPAKAAKSTRRRDDDDEDEDEDDRPRRRKPVAKPNNSKVVIGVVAGVLLLVGGVVAIFAFGGSKEKDKEVAKVDPPPKTKQDPKPGPGPKPPDTTNPIPKPPEKEPVEPPPPPVVPDTPVVEAPAEDVFVRAATFKPEGPLPELPPLPPIERRPLLALDPGGHTAFVRHVFFTPDGAHVITVSDDKSVRLWDVFSGEPLGSIRLPAGLDNEGTPHAAALSPDGKRLAIGCFPLNRGKSGIPIYILSTETGELEKVVSGAREVPQSLDFSPDGTRLAVGCANGYVQVLEIDTGKRLYGTPGHPGQIRHVRFNPKQALVASIGRENEVKIWSLGEVKQPKATISLVEQGPGTLDWSSDGKTLAVGCTSGEVYLYDAAGKPIKTVPPFREPRSGAAVQIARMKFLPGDKQLVFGGIAALGWAGVIDIESGKRPVIIKDHTNTVMTVTCSPNGLLAASCGGDSNETLVWSTADGTVLGKFAASSRGLWAVGWGKDGKSLAWGTTNGANSQDLSALEMTLRLDEFAIGEKPVAAAFQRHVRKDDGFSIKVDDFFSFTVSENGKPIYKHTAAPAGNRIYSVSIVPGKGIVVGASFQMYMIETKTGKPLRKFIGDSGLTTALAPSPDGRYFVSGSTDQVIRVWTPEKTEPLLSIFNAGREWIAWTPQGYYDCSPYGERLIGWQVNNGIDKLPTVHPAVRFRPSLYQPSLIKYLIPAGNLQLALAMAAKYDRQSVSVAGLGDVLPPTVTITAPANTMDAEVSIKAVAEGSARNPIVAMRLLVDGRPYQGTAGVKRFTPSLEKAEATWKVALSPGIHSLIVMGESAVSKGLSSPATVTKGGKEELPNLYVLAVGVSDYPGDMKLNYAASDAHLLSKTLKEKSKGVFGNIEVRTLTDKDASKKGIMEGLDWLGAKMTSKDVGIFSFSGHGGRDPRSGRFFLVPVDVNDADPLGSCLTGDEFKSRLENMPGRLIAILDACHSGAASAPEKPQKQKPTAGRADNLVRDLMTDDYGVIVMCSSLGNEYSMESSATKAGFFTLGLTEGLNGKADLNKDGIVYIHELDYYAAMRVKQLSGGRQNPTLGRPPTIRPFPLSKP